MTTGEIISICAIVAGPLTAMGVSLFVNHFREKRKEKIIILLTLMQTRTAIPQPTSFIDALNSIDVVFHRDKKVMIARNDFFDIWRNKNRNENEYKNRLRDLLDAMTKSLGYKNIKPSDLDSLFTPFIIGGNITQEI
jgi:hypothetical protein